MRFDAPEFHGMRLSVLAMARGEHGVEDVAEGEMVALVIVVGCVQVTRSRAGQPANFSLHATRTAPLFLVNPGRYVIVTERNVLGFRGSRQQGVIV
jgi:hypothetical protein